MNLTDDDLGDLTAAANEALRLATLSSTVDRSPDAPFALPSIALSLSVLARLALDRRVDERVDELRKAATTRSRVAADARRETENDLLGTADSKHSYRAGVLGACSWRYGFDRTPCGRLEGHEVHLHARIPGGKYPPTAAFAGASSARQAVGLPGHCDRCAEVGHVAAHPDLGCGDVGCSVAHGPLCEWELPTGVRCASQEHEHDGLRIVHPFIPDVIQGTAPPANEPTVGT